MIRTDRLLLRRATARDLDPLFAITSDPIAMAYWNTPAHATKDDTRKLITRLMRNKSLSRYLIFEHDGALIGMGGLHGRAEIGYLLDPKVWGQGFAFEAISAIIPQIWAETTLKEVKVVIDPRNSASLKLAHRLGFQETHRKERTICKDGVWSDSVYFVLRRPKT